MKNWMKTALSTALVGSMLTTWGSALTLLPQSLPLQRPTGLTQAEDGSLYIADTYSNQIYHWDDGQLTLISGIDIGLPNYPDGVDTLVDGSAEGALFCHPQGLAAYGKLLYVADTENHAVRQIIAGQVRTLFDQNDGLNRPTALAVAENGDVYLANAGKGEILRYDLSRKALVPFAEGLVYPTDLLLQADGTLLVVDGGSHQILSLDAKGNPTTIAGQYKLEGDAYVGGYADGSTSEAIFQDPRSIVADGDTYYITDLGNSAIRKIKDGQVTTLIQYDPWSESVYPLQPYDFVLEGNLLWVSDTMGGFLFVQALVPFLDVAPDAWYYDAVCFGMEHQLFQGSTPTTFSPDAPMTRATLTQLLYNLEGQPQGAVTTDFADVAPDAWYAPSVAWAVEQGLTQGTGDGGFNPDGELTREELVVFLHRYAQQKGWDVTAQGDLTPFPDSATLSPWAQEACQWALGAGLLSGTDQGDLAPQLGASRAQGATLFQRLLTDRQG